MEVLKKKDIIYRCPVCQSISKAEPDDIVVIRGKAIVKCPCCNAGFWLYKIDFDNTKVIFNENIQSTLKK